MGYLWLSFRDTFHIISTHIQLPPSAIISEPCQVVSIIPCKYLVIVPVPRFCRLDTCLLISEMKVTSVVTPSIGLTLVILSPIVLPLFSKSLFPRTSQKALTSLYLRGFAAYVINTLYSSQKPC